MQALQLKHVEVLPKESVRNNKKVFFFLSELAAAVFG
jgi:hypothetical protein